MGAEPRKSLILCPGRGNQRGEQQDWNLCTPSSYAALVARVSGVASEEWLRIVGEDGMRWEKREGIKLGKNSILAR